MQMKNTIPLLLLPILVACSSEKIENLKNDSSKEISALILNEIDNHRQISIRKGARVSIELKENRTTGYEWVLANFNEKSMSFKGVEHISAKALEVGKGGHSIHLFEAKEPMTSSIELLKRRSWDQEDMAIERFKITVSVTE